MFIMCHLKVLTRSGLRIEKIQWVGRAWGGKQICMEHSLQQYCQFVIATPPLYLSYQVSCKAQFLVRCCLLGKDFFTSTLTSANWCSSQGRGLTPYLHLPWPWMGLLVSRYKYLGVTISSDLSWSPHITNCCSKTRRLIGLLYGHFYWYTNSRSLLRLYKSFIRPHLDYASIVWNPHFKGEIESLENVQKFALWVYLLGFWIQWAAQSFPIVHPCTRNEFN